MVEYNFTSGRYRAKVKTTYKREDMSMNDYVVSDPYEFTSAGHPAPPEPSVEKKNLIYCQWSSSSVTFRATVGQEYEFVYQSNTYDDCYYPFAFWAAPNSLIIVGGDLDNYGVSYISNNASLYSGAPETVHQLEPATCPIFESFNQNCLTWARQGYL